jgi:hypothetical protein
MRGAIRSNRRNFQTRNQIKRELRRSVTGANPTATPVTSRGPKWSTRLTVFGTGIVVMLADTDAGGVITAAQSGAECVILLFTAALASAAVSPA